MLFLLLLHQVLPKRHLFRLRPGDLLADAQRGFLHSLEDLRRRTGLCRRHRDDRRQLHALPGGQYEQRVDVELGNRIGEVERECRYPFKRVGQRRLVKAQHLAVHVRIVLPDRFGRAAATGAGAADAKRRNPSDSNIGRAIKAVLVRRK